MVLFAHVFQATTIISGLSDLAVWQLKDRKGLYILLDDIATVLRKNNSSNDRIKIVKKGNIIQEIVCLFVCLCLTTRQP